jgi:hypothetical protein
LGVRGDLRVRILVDFGQVSLVHSSHNIAAFLPDDKIAIAEDPFSSLGKYSSAELTRQELTLLVALDRVRR